MRAPGSLPDSAGADGERGRAYFSTQYRLYGQSRLRSKSSAVARRAHHRRQGRASDPHLSFSATAPTLAPASAPPSSKLANSTGRPRSIPSTEPASRAPARALVAPHTESGLDLSCSVPRRTPSIGRRGPLPGLPSPKGGPQTAPPRHPAQDLVRLHRNRPTASSPLTAISDLKCTADRSGCALAPPYCFALCMFMGS